MQNPFRRLKHYRSEDIDPKENHATEALAACLVFSESFRGEFLKFLFSSTTSELPRGFCDAGQVEVVTQLFTEDSGTIDLILKRDSCCVVVEVKVGARERDPRHEEQLDRYQGWLCKNFHESALFTLVRDPDVQFKHDGVLKRCKWSDLFENAAKFAKNCDNTTDSALLEAFCDYLTLEGIVDNMDYTTLVNYGKGWAAEKALEGLFSKTTDLLKLATPDLLEPRNHELKGQSPSYQFGRKSWEKIFGKGWNNKVYAWFCTPATEGPEDGKGCEFRFEIWLWDKAHEHDWTYSAKHLPVWLSHFSKKKFDRGCYARRGNWLEWKDGQALDPARNYVVIPIGYNLPVSVDNLKDIDGFANQLEQKVKNCFRLVDELRGLV